MSSYMRDSSTQVAQQSGTQNQIAVTKVVVAKGDLRFGVALREDMFKEVQWPQEAVHSGIFKSVEEIFDGDGERVVIKAISMGEPIVKTKISGFGEKSTLSQKVADNKRAFSIRVNDVSGVAGFLLPGDRVDIMLTRKVGEKRDNLVADIILQNIVILGIDQASDEDRDQPAVARTATVEVDPEQSQKLALAQQIGTLSLALRNVKSAENISAGRVTADDLGIDRKSGNGGDTVRVRRGAGKVVIKRVQ
jgi:pilus assembly protein CpaB